MFIPSLFHALRGSTESHKTRVFFSVFSLCYFQKSSSDYFQHFSRKLLQPMKTTTETPKTLSSHWGQLNVSLCFTYLCCVCWGLSVSHLTTLVRPAYWGVESVFFALWYLHFLQLGQTRGAEIAVCASWQELLTVVNSPWASQSPKVLSSIFLTVSPAINSNPSPENPSFLDPSNPCSQPAAVSIHCKTHRYSLWYLWCPGL